MDQAAAGGRSSPAVINSTSSSPSPSSSSSSAAAAVAESPTAARSQASSGSRREEGDSFWPQGGGEGGGSPGSLLSTYFYLPAVVGDLRAAAANDGDACQRPQPSLLRPAAAESTAVPRDRSGSSSRLDAARVDGLAQAATNFPLQTFRTSSPFLSHAVAPGAAAGTGRAVQPPCELRRYSTTAAAATTPFVPSSLPAHFLFQPGSIREAILQPGAAPESLRRRASISVAGAAASADSSSGAGVFTPPRTAASGSTRPDTLYTSSCSSRSSHTQPEDQALAAGTAAATAARLRFSSTGAAASATSPSATPRGAAAPAAGAAPAFSHEAPPSAAAGPVAAVTAAAQAAAPVASSAAAADPAATGPAPAARAPATLPVRSNSYLSRAPTTASSLASEARRLLGFGSSGSGSSSTASASPATPASKHRVAQLHEAEELRWDTARKRGSAWELLQQEEQQHFEEKLLLSRGETHCLYIAGDEEVPGILSLDREALKFRSTSGGISPFSLLEAKEAQRQAAAAAEGSAGVTVPGAAPHAVVHVDISLTDILECACVTAPLPCEDEFTAPAAAGARGSRNSFPWDGDSAAAAAGGAASASSAAGGEENSSRHADANFARRCPRVGSSGRSSTWDVLPHVAGAATVREGEKAAAAAHAGEKGENEQIAGGNKRRERRLTASAEDAEAAAEVAALLQPRAYMQLLLATLEGASPFEAKLCNLSAAAATEAAAAAAAAANQLHVVVGRRTSPKQQPQLKQQLTQQQNLKHRPQQQQQTRQQQLQQQTDEHQSCSGVAVCGRRPGEAECSSMTWATLPELELPPAGVPRHVATAAEQQQRQQQRSPSSSTAAAAGSAPTGPGRGETEDREAAACTGAAASSAAAAGEETRTASQTCRSHRRLVETMGSADVSRALAAAAAEAAADAAAAADARRGAEASYGRTFSKESIPVGGFDFFQQRATDDAAAASAAPHVPSSTGSSRSHDPACSSGSGSSSGCPATAEQPPKKAASRKEEEEEGEEGLGREGSGWGEERRAGADAAGGGSLQRPAVDVFLSAGTALAGDSTISEASGVPTQACDFSPAATATADLSAAAAAPHRTSSDTPSAGGAAADSSSPADALQQPQKPDSAAGAAASAGLGTAAAGEAAAAAGDATAGATVALAATGTAAAAAARPAFAESAADTAADSATENAAAPASQTAAAGAAEEASFENVGDGEMFFTTYAPSASSLRAANSPSLPLSPAAAASSSPVSGGADRSTSGAVDLSPTAAAAARAGDGTPAAAVSNAAAAAMEEPLASAAMTAAGVGEQLLHEEQRTQTVSSAFSPARLLVRGASTLFDLWRGFRRGSLTQHDPQQLPLQHSSEQQQQQAGEQENRQQQQVMLQRDDREKQQRGEVPELHAEGLLPEGMKEAGEGYSGNPGVVELQQSRQQQQRRRETLQQQLQLHRKSSSSYFSSKGDGKPLLLLPSADAAAPPPAATPQDSGHSTQCPGVTAAAAETLKQAADAAATAAGGGEGERAESRMKDADGKSACFFGRTHRYSQELQQQGAGSGSSSGSLGAQADSGPCEKGTTTQERQQKADARRRRTSSSSSTSNSSRKAALQQQQRKRTDASREGKGGGDGRSSGRGNGRRTVRLFVLFGFRRKDIAQEFTRAVIRFIDQCKAVHPNFRAVATHVPRSSNARVERWAAEAAHFAAATLGQAAAAEPLPMLREQQHEQLPGARDRAAAAAADARVPSAAADMWHFVTENEALHLDGGSPVASAAAVASCAAGGGGGEILKHASSTSLSAGDSSVESTATAAAGEGGKGLTLQRSYSAAAVPVTAPAVAAQLPAARRLRDSRSSSFFRRRRGEGAAQSSRCGSSRSSSSSGIRLGDTASHTLRNRKRLSSSSGTRPRRHSAVAATGAAATEEEFESDGASPSFDRVALAAASESEEDAAAAGRAEEEEEDEEEEEEEEDEEGETKQVVCAGEPQQQEMHGPAQGDQLRHAADWLTLPTPEFVIPRGAAQILTPAVAAQLALHLPLMLSMKKWVLAFCHKLSGISLNTFYRRCSNAGPCLLLIQDAKGVLFGAFLDEIHESCKYYGTAETFVFTFKGPDNRMNWDRPEIHVYRWSSLNSYYIYTDHEILCVGGGGQYAITVDKDLLRGCSSCCLTFSSPVLAGSEDFIVKAFQVWVFSDE